MKLPTSLGSILQTLLTVVIALVIIKFIPPLKTFLYS